MTHSGHRPATDDARALTGAVARGDQDALADLYKRYFDRCYATARRISRRDESFCLDVVQDTMMKAARSIKPLDTTDQLERWLTRVVYSVCVDRLRAERRRAERERHLDARAQSDANDRIDWLEEQIATLPPDDRSLLSLRFGLGHTLRHTADAHGISEHAAHGRIRRLLEQLRRSAKVIL